MTRQFEAMQAPLAAVTRRLIELGALGQTLGSSLSNAAMVSVAVVGSVMVIDGQLSGGSLIACTLLAGRAVQPVIRMIGVWVQWRSLVLARERLSLIDKLPQPRPPETLVSELPPLTRGLQLDNVTVHRGRPDLPILANVTLDFAAGQTVALVGPTAGGKSVMLEAIAGLIGVDDGAVRYDGIDIRGVDQRVLRRRMGYVRQKSGLLRGTLRDNLARFGGDAALSRALEIADRLGLSETIATMPGGLDTQIGDGASETLPTSVQQVIALSMMFADDPDVLLLDQANSALDARSDRALRDYLAGLKGRRTIVLVTERPSMIALADRVIEVTKGGVNELPRPVTGQSGGPGRAGLRLAHDGAVGSGTPPAGATPAEGRA